MRALSVIASLLLLACTSARTEAAGCPPTGYDRARLEALRAANWQVDDQAARNQLARALVPCLASADGHIRDELAFDGLQHWMRSGELDASTVLAIGDELQTWLTAPEGEGFSRPFAALVLAEVARTDRMHPWMTPARRQSLLEASTGYLTNVRDYRGFEDGGAGWRHGVAHGADLMVQLALNPAFGKQELTRIRDAVATQIAPAGHFYTYGEGGRLAAAIVCVARRNVFSAAEWTAWIGQVTSPAPLASWNDAYTSQIGIARARDMHDFVAALYIDVKLEGNSNDEALLAGVEAALRALS